MNRKATTAGHVACVTGQSTWDELCEGPAAERAGSVLVRLGHQLVIAGAAGRMVTAEDDPLRIAGGLLQAHWAFARSSLLIIRRRMCRQRPPRLPRAICTRSLLSPICTNTQQELHSTTACPGCKSIW